MGWRRPRLHEVALSIHHRLIHCSVQRKKERKATFIKVDQKATRRKRRKKNHIPLTTFCFNPEATGTGEGEGCQEMLEKDRRKSELWKKKKKKKSREIVKKRIVTPGVTSVFSTLSPTWGSFEITARTYAALCFCEGIRRSVIQEEEGKRRKKKEKKEKTRKKREKKEKEEKRKKGKSTKRRRKKKKKRWRRRGGRRERRRERRKKGRAWTTRSFFAPAVSCPQNSSMSERTFVAGICDARLYLHNLMQRERTSVFDWELRAWVKMLVNTVVPWKRKRKKFFDFNLKLNFKFNIRSFSLILNFKF